MTQVLSITGPCPLQGAERTEFVVQKLYHHQHTLDLSVLHCHMLLGSSVGRSCMCTMDLSHRHSALMHSVGYFGNTAIEQ